MADNMVGLVGTGDGPVVRIRKQGAIFARITGLPSDGYVEVKRFVNRQYVSTQMVMENGLTEIDHCEEIQFSCKGGSEATICAVQVRNAVHSS